MFFVFFSSRPTLFSFIIIVKQNKYTFGDDVSGCWWVVLVFGLFGCDRACDHSNRIYSSAISNKTKKKKQQRTLQKKTTEVWVLFVFFFLWSSGGNTGAGVGALSSTAWSEDDVDESTVVLESSLSAASLWLLLVLLLGHLFAVARIFKPILDKQNKTNKQKQKQKQKKVLYSVGIDAYLWCLTLYFTGTSQTTVDLTTDKTEVEVNGRLVHQVVCGERLVVRHRLTVEEQVHGGRILDVETLGQSKLFIKQTTIKYPSS